MTSQRAAFMRLIARGSPATLRRHRHGSGRPAAGSTINAISTKLLQALEEEGFRFERKRCTTPTARRVVRLPLVPQRRNQPRDDHGVRLLPPFYGGHIYRQKHLNLLKKDDRIALFQQCCTENEYASRAYRARHRRLTWSLKPWTPKNSATARPSPTVMIEHTVNSPGLTKQRTDRHGRAIRN